MEEIGNLFMTTRESAGVSLKEASEDLDVDEVILENIEDGKPGAFSDVFALKECIINYAKYLGLDSDKIVDEFNEYIFEATSKIPIKEIEKQIAENNKEDNDLNKIISPYTKKTIKNRSYIFVIIYTIAAILMLVTAIWSIKQVTVKSQNASSINNRK